jgi:glycosyltransferase involved in cell wall biosynthesis
MAKFFLRFVKDFQKKKRLLYEKTKEIERLSSTAYPNLQNRKVLDLSRQPVYLRTDFAFGLISGGSIGHTAGVLNHLDLFSGKPIFLTTSAISTVRREVKSYVILPSNAFWDFREIPTIHFNQVFEGIAQRCLEDKKLSFVYQRYSLNNYSGLKLSTHYGIPFILEYNGSEIWMSENWGRPLKYRIFSEKVEILNLRMADLIVVVSDAMRIELGSRGIDAEKILVNPNGVDPDRYTPGVDGSEVRKRHQLGERTVIGFIGTFGKWHGAEILAEAFGKLLHKYPEYQERVKLFMIGDGITMPLVKENINKFAIKESCVLTGLVPQEKGPEYLAACDILVASHKPNPDGTPFFGSPTKLFEYMAMGKGIVASDLDQIGEVLKHDYTAWLVKPGDIDSLMIGLKTLIDDEPRRVKLGKAAREEVIAKYTWREHTRKIIEKLKERCG